ncbi:MAG TPA: YbaK/EbsC family protein [Symbiobacteriaceae bacterium]
MTDPLRAETAEPEPLRRVRTALQAAGVEGEIRLFPAPLPTAEAAAKAVGSDLGRIAKSVLFFAGGEPVLVVTAGDRRVDRKKVKALMGGGKVTVASAEQVPEVTGFVAGGVAPVGLLRPVTVLLDESLQRFPDIWAGGGIPEALLRIRVADLPRATGGRFADVTQD